MDEIEMKEFGSYLKRLRLEKKLSLRQVEKAVGISNSYLYQIERGERNVPKLEVLRKMAATYDVSFASLMAAARLQEPEQEDEFYKNTKMIELAFDLVRNDPDYIFGTHLNASDISLEVKRFVVEMYQSATGRNLLTKKTRREKPHDQDDTETDGQNPTGDLF